MVMEGLTVRSFTSQPFTRTATDSFFLRRQRVRPTDDAEVAASAPSTQMQRARESRQRIARTRKEQGNGKASKRWQTSLCIF